MDIDMDIKELEAFVYVVENCSFSRAAELLHLCLLYTSPSPRDTR